MIVVVLIIAYLLGSLPSAVLVGKLFYNTDVRDHGSGNAGATNTFRVLGKKAGMIVFILDFVKGYIAAGFVLFIFTSLHTKLLPEQIQLICGWCGVLGHVFPVFAGFRGGKGVATTFGVFVAVFPWSAVICAVIFFSLLLLFHYVSLGSMIAVLAFTPLSFFIYQAKDGLTITLMLLFAVAIIVLHRKNIERLLNGTENKIYLFKTK